MGTKETPEWIKKLTKDKKKKSEKESDWMDKEKMKKTEKAVKDKGKSRWSKIKDLF